MFAIIKTEFLKIKRYHILLIGLIGMFCSPLLQLFSQMAMNEELRNPDYNFARLSDLGQYADFYAGFIHTDRRISDQPGVYGRYAQKHTDRSYLLPEISRRKTDSHRYPVRPFRNIQPDRYTRCQFLRRSSRHQRPGFFLRPAAGHPALCSDLHYRPSGHHFMQPEARAVYDRFHDLFSGGIQCSVFQAGTAPASLSFFGGADPYRL